MPAFRATYRLQLGAGMTFADAAALVPYLRDLGVSHLYLSPAFAAREGSTHGYDVVDPTRLSDALGGEDGFRALAAIARAAGLGIVLDIVPNHMATDDANPYWTDPERRARFFDLDSETGAHRRFFDIDDLAGVRQEDPDVFAETHRLPLALVREGLVDGLRVDHPDGLADPARYLEWLRDGGAEHVWVEKILMGSHPPEPLRDWPVEGTVGYEFLNDVCALFVDPAGEAPLTALWEGLCGDARPFGVWAAEAKLEQARTTFAPEVDWLRRLWPGVEGLEEALAALPVYRTYIRDLPAPEDLRVLREAGLIEWLARAPQDFLTRFEQTTPPVMAKGVEDTAFYRYARLLALNDVGGDPGRFSLPVREFHAANAQRAPCGLLTTQTHDTKRSGDVRARIGALAGMAEEWADAVRRWRALCAPLRAGGAPDAIEEYTILQTLVGAWPISPERLCAYLEKALREAKRNTSWVEPDAGWEERVLAYCRALYDHPAFLAAFEPFAERVTAAGELHALRQTALKLTVPGVPDIYQGDELVALSLVDPDNRRPVDWGRRRALLADLRVPADADERKLFLIRELLALRARRSAAFAGRYEPLDAGPDAVAFLRGDEVAVALPIRAGGLDPSRLELPWGTWRPAFDADLLPGAQIAVLERT